MDEKLRFFSSQNPLVTSEIENISHYNFLPYENYAMFDLKVFENCFSDSFAMVELSFLFMERKTLANFFCILTSF